ncbi:OmpH family outer membrane protein [Bacteroidales bacterium OttesenSCG-928-M06]|nr:OmpH family outer membrane protein [Bacteroidales bacterium OttesenSCG-928-M06]
MKSTKCIVNGIMVMATLVLVFSQCANNKAETAPVETISTTENLPQYLPIAYVDQDSMFTHFDYYNSLIGSLENKISKQRTNLNNDYQKFQKEVVDYQQKRQNNAFLSQERIIQEETRLERMQQDLEKKTAQIEQELALEQRVIQQQISDSLTIGIAEFNNPQKYQMILTKSGNQMVLYADEHYNITNEVIEFLNKRFKSE